MTQPYYVLEVRTADGAVETHEVSDEKRIVGRSKIKADLQVADKKASGRHVEMAFAGGKLTVTDLGSTNGTFYGGKRATTPFELNPGDGFRVGDATIRLLSVHGLEDDLKTQVSMMSWDEEPEESTRAMDMAEMAALTGAPAEPPTQRQAPAPRAPAWPDPAPARQPEPMAQPEPEMQPVADSWGAEEAYAEPVQARPVEAPADDWANAYQQPADAAPAQAQAGADVPIPRMQSGGAVQLDKKQEQAMANVALLPGETITNIWEADGVILEAIPGAKLAAMIQRFILMITGGYIRVYLVLTNQRLIVVQATRDSCGLGSARVADTLAASAIHTVGIGKQSWLFCCHSRLVRLHSKKTPLTLIMRRFKDEDARSFMNQMAVHMMEHCTD